MVRVIAGSAGGLLLKVPKGRQTRPTADRVKESLFAILGAEVPGAHVLDLFAGSGALGIEALSRGAACARFVERDARTAALVRQNLEVTHLAAKAEVEVTAADAGAGWRPSAYAPFDLVFCDPPYNRGFIPKTLTALDKAAVVAHDALLVLEHGGKEELSFGVPNPLAVSEQALVRVVRREDYGDTAITFCRWLPARTARRGGGLS